MEVIKREMRRVEKVLGRDGELATLRHGMVGGDGGALHSGVKALCGCVAETVGVSLRCIVDCKVQVAWVARRHFRMPLEWQCVG